ncbi:MAG: ABC transporter ATP-binding protein [Lachnospiraceae bacterium]|nr:ABC transporter ATP-binding protein [Lachnospiraceae bacterium]
MYMELTNISKDIGKTNILHDINLYFEGGKVYGLRGKNGCGKTMLMRVMSGLIKPTTGKVVINDKELWKDMTFPDSIGILIENPSFIDRYTGYQNLKMLADIKGLIGESEIKEALVQVGLEPEDKRKYRKYSLGMKQKLGIACAFMEHPDIIIMDEPINAIDQSGVELVRNIMDNLKQEGKIIIIACHDAEEMELLADEIFVMEDGTIVSK